MLLPHLRDRPFTIKRHYTVPRGPFRWIKDAPPELPDWIPVSPQPAKSRRGELLRYPLVDDVESLLWMSSSTSIPAARSATRPRG